MQNADPPLNAVARERVTPVLVTYNAEAIISRCLNELRWAKRIVLVDSKSSDRTIEIARAILPKLELISLTRNQGYGTAVNRGLERVETEFALCINPDMRLDSGAVEILISTADANPAAAGVAPLIVNSRGGYELDVMGPSEIHHRGLASDPQGAFCTWFLTGAVVLWRRAALERIGGFDESIFLYSEDADVCLRLTRAGYGLVLEPAARARDIGGGTRSAKLRSRIRRDWNRVWGHLYYERKHGPAGSANVIARDYVKKCRREALLGLLTLRLRKFLTNRAKQTAAQSFLRGDPPWGRK